MKENCLIRKTCKNSNNCPEFCITYEHILDMFAKSNLNPNYWEFYPIDFYIQSDVEAYLELKEICKNLENWPNNFHSLYIWSDKYLNGKTMWSIRLLQIYMSLWTEYRFDNVLAGYYINASDLVSIFKKQVDNEEQFTKTTNYLKNSELLVIDDIDRIIKEEKVQTWLSGILNYRYDNKYSVIFTSHLSPEEFKSKCSDKYLSSRIIDLSKTIQFTADPYKKSENGGIN